MIRLALLCSLVLMLVVSCGCGPTGGNDPQMPADEVMSQRIRLLTGLLEQELQRQGKDITHITATAPTGTNNSVFDLTGVAQAGGIQLEWTEQLIGDYDQNSEVGAPDLQPLAAYLNQTVEYDSPSLHNGIDRWPAGDKDAGGAINWRKARIDGDSNTEIGSADITPIAQHFGEKLSGYRIYRQAPGEGAYSLLHDPEDATAPESIKREKAAYSNTTPVRYTFNDTTATVSGIYHYRIAPYDNGSGTEGTVSVEITVDTGATTINADLTADPLIGRAPLNVNFDASGSTATAGITQYEWDWEGDGTYDQTGTSPTITHPYNALGTFQPTVRITDSTTATDTASVQVQVVSNVPPTAAFTATPGGGSPPLTVSFNGSTSSDTDGTIVQYEWDYDGDFTFDETNSSPNASHEYTADGNYTVTLRVTDNEGATDTEATSINVVTQNDPPEAVLQANPASGAPPLKVTFFSSSSSDDGSIVSREYDYDGDGTYDDTGNDSVVQHWYNDEGVYTAVLRVTDNLGASSTDSKTITVSNGPIPPTAVLEISVTEGFPTLSVNLDASGSTAPSGGITKYEWDWEGDGTYDQTGTSPTTSHDYLKAGYYTPTVRVTDNQALTDTDSKNVTVHGWAFKSVDTQGTSGQHASLAIIDGNPAIAYYRFIEGLQYCRSLDEFGGQWGTSVKVEGPPTLPNNWGSGQFNSLLEVNGRPAVAYCENSDSLRYLKYVRASDATGAAWPTSQILATGPMQNSDMEIVNGNPGIAYYDGAIDGLRFIRATNADGSAWGSPVTIASGDGQGYKLRLEVVSGNPAIAYVDNWGAVPPNTNPGFDLYYTRATDANGSAWPGSPVNIDFDTSIAVTTGISISMKVVNGNPAIAYIWRHVQTGNTYERVYFIRASNATGSAWSPRLQLQAPSGTPNYEVNLAEFGGLPVVGYANRADHLVSYQASSDADGTSWGGMQTIASDAGIEVEALTMMDVNGKLAVVYFDSDTADLIYAVLL